MAVGSGTPDRARVRRDVRSGARVEGRYVTEPAFSKPFRCRYAPAQESESRTQTGVQRVKPATLFVHALSLRAAGVSPLKASDRVEIALAGQTLLMEVQGEPKPTRKRRLVIGWVASLQKVRDSEAPNVA